MYIEKQLQKLDTLTKHISYDDSKFKINCDFLKYNVRDECYRDRLVHFLPMLPLLEESVPLEEADYILYAHPYARVEDFSEEVYAQIECINYYRKKGAEIIIVGKATNIKDKIGNNFENITYIESYYPEILGERFGLDLHTEYIVYDDTGEETIFDDEGYVINFEVFAKKQLNIWPVNGCYNKCKFCRRSYMDIPFYSIPLEVIKEKLDYYNEYEPEKLFYVDLRAENLTQYGLDIYGKPMLHELIKLVASYEYVKYIGMRIGMNIGEITPEILEAMCSCNKMYFMGLNLEAGSNRLLNTIGKMYTREQAINVYTKLRETYPNLLIDCTVMVGLPTETMSDIYDLADLINQTSPNEILINFYGLASGQPLAKLPQLSKSLKKYHLNLLLNLLKKSSREYDLVVTYQRFLDESKRKDCRTSLINKGVDASEISLILNSSSKLSYSELKNMEKIPKQFRWAENIVRNHEEDLYLPGNKTKQKIKKI